VSPSEGTASPFLVEGGRISDSLFFFFEFKRTKEFAAKSENFFIEKFSQMSYD